MMHISGHYIYIPLFLITSPTNPDKSADQISKIKRPNKSAQQIGTVCEIWLPIWEGGLDKEGVYVGVCSKQI